MIVSSGVSLLFFAVQSIKGQLMLKRKYQESYVDLLRILVKRGSANRGSTAYQNYETHFEESFAAISRIFSGRYKPYGVIGTIKGNNKKKSFLKKINFTFIKRWRLKTRGEINYLIEMFIVTNIFEKQRLKKKEKERKQRWHFSVDFKIQLFI